MKYLCYRPDHELPTDREYVEADKASKAAELYASRKWNPGGDTEIRVHTDCQDGAGPYHGPHEWIVSVVLVPEFYAKPA